MSSQYEQAKNNLASIEQSTYSYENFVNTLRESAIGLDVTPETYEDFETVSVALMSDVIDAYERVAPLDPRHQRQMAHAKDIIQEGLGHLVASRRDGLAFPQFERELHEWKAIWEEQLQTA